MNYLFFLQTARKLLLGLITLILFSASASAAWEPTKPIEFVVPAGAGGVTFSSIARACY